MTDGVGEVSNLGQHGQKSPGNGGDDELIEITIKRALNMPYPDHDSDQRDPGFLRVSVDAAVSDVDPVSLFEE